MRTVAIFSYYSSYRLSSWDVLTERKNLGFLFAIDLGAEEVIDFVSGESLPRTQLLDKYIPVTYPTGLLWNPYPTMMGSSDLWPACYPSKLKSTKQEVLNDAMEKVPTSSIGQMQILLRPTLGSQPLHLTLALGLKTFAPLTEATTLFTRSSLWALFLPKDTSPATQRGRLAQPLMWRLGLHTAFSLAQGSEENWKASSRSCEIDMVLLRTLRETNLTRCTTLAACLYLLYSIYHPASLPFLNAWLEDLAKIGYHNPELRRHRHFAYLTQGGALTSTSNPRLNSTTKSSTTFDIFYLSFGSAGSGDLFFPNSTYQQGRNALLRLALAMEVSPGYDYFIFTDEDVSLENVDDSSHFWKQDMSSDPWIRMEVIMTRYTVR